MREYYDSHSPSKVVMYQAAARRRLRGSDVGRTYTGWKAVLAIVAVLTATFLGLNYLAEAAKDAEPLRMEQQ